jgi:hypothetical protein
MLAINISRLHHENILGKKYNLARFMLYIVVNIDKH